MHVNLDLTHGALLAERVSGALAPALGAMEAHDVVRAAAGPAFAEKLAADPRVAARLSTEDIAELLDPAGYLGSADALIDRALRAAAR
jgi:3-carboxy-cis,cis-muconate cycloisomerase